MSDLSRSCFGLWLQKNSQRACALRVTDHVRAFMTLQLLAQPALKREIHEAPGPTRLDSLDHVEGKALGHLGDTTGQCSHSICKLIASRDRTQLPGLGESCSKLSADE